MRDITDNKSSITELQRYLRELHHDSGGALPLVNPDGIYGAETAAAVEEFQRTHGLPVTGRTDNATWDAIYKEFLAAITRRAAPASISPFPSEDGYEITSGENSDTVMAVQLILRLLANLYDNIEGNASGGVYDEPTAADIREFQAVHRLPITGRVDKTTWNELAEAYNRAMDVRTG